MAITPYYSVLPKTHVTSSTNIVDWLILGICLIIQTAVVVLERTRQALYNESRAV